jgi:hypothetical protein
MAVYVPIRKDRETDGGFIYRYLASDGSIGLLEIDKSTGSTRPIAIAPGDSEQRSYALAARKLLMHFQAGEFPEETCWAS